jgi:hypothetical protein
LERVSDSHCSDVQTIRTSDRISVCDTGTGRPTGK